MHCNIDKRGQRVRMVLGVWFITAGVVLFAATMALEWSAWLYVPAAMLVLSGGFAVFESRSKWCAVRAMGFRTPV